MPFGRKTNQSIVFLILFMFPAMMVAAITALISILTLIVAGLLLHRATLAMTYCSACCSTDHAAQNRTITTTHTMANCRARSTAYCSTEYRATLGIIGTCCQQQYRNQS